jgi:hypothetical protein
MRRIEISIYWTDRLMSTKSQSIIGTPFLFAFSILLMMAAIPPGSLAQEPVPLESILSRAEQQALGITTMRPEQRETLRQALVRQYLSGYRTAQSRSGSTSAVTTVESQVDGEFNGWEGETIVKLLNGQIWQQTEYHYEYRYAYMPKVLVYPSGSGYKMKIEGAAAVGVQRLK